MTSAERLASTLSVMTTWQEKAEFTRRDGVFFARGTSRFPSPYSNAALPISEPASLESVIARADAHFTDRRYVLWIPGSEESTLAASAVSRGFMSLGSIPVMAVDRRIEPPAADGGLLKVVDDAETFREFVEVSLAAYEEVGLPRKVGETLFARSESVLESCACIVVAYAGGRPAGGALSIVNRETGVGGVYWVGTIPGVRRRGIGEAVTRMVTNAAFDQGARSVALEASQAGESVYARIGYRDVGRYARFLSPKAPG